MGVSEPPQRSGDLGFIPQVEVPGSSDKLVIASVMIVTSKSGTPAAQRMGAFSATAGRLAQMANLI